MFVDDNDLTRKGGGFKASFKVGGIMGWGEKLGARCHGLWVIITGT